MDVALTLGAPLAGGAEVVHTTVVFLEFCGVVKKTVNDRNSLAESVTDS